jgi:hypothetical protein
MDAKILKNIILFMERTQLRGGEAHAYVEAHTLVTQMIKSLETPEPMAIRGADGVVGPSEMPSTEHLEA